MSVSPRPLFLIAAVLFALAVFWMGSSSRDTVAEVRDLVGHDRVVLFTASWCGYCDRLRTDLVRSEVSFVEHDIESSSAINGAWRRLGGRGVPLTLVDDQVIAGYAPDRIRQLIGPGF